MKFSLGTVGIFLAGSIIAATAMATVDPNAPEKPTRSRYDELLDKTARDQDETHQRNLKLMERLEKNQERQEADITRYEKILDTWERQQAEYQKYLDSLHK